MFDAIGTSGTGLQTYHTWLDAVADNIANVNDTAPSNGQVFHSEYVQVSAVGNGSDGVGRGVAVTAVRRGDNGELEQDPTNPIADSQGFVRHADVDLSQQMGDMIMAQRAFQANATAIGHAKDVYEAAISIGKGI
jgi:flagellar basal-body rod protein FlgC